MTVTALEYPSNKELAQELNQLTQNHPTTVSLSPLALTHHGNEVWLVELGRGTPEERRQRPALLLVAGIEGNDLAGTVSALYWIKQLANQSENDSAATLLNNTTLYIVPRLNPDGMARAFAKPRTEASVSFKPVDDDHDGLTDEDGPDDLNQDNLITSVRIEDPEGEYILDPVDPRLLLKTDRTKGERGAWRLITEGRDDDHDEAWNEDGPGGVNFNRNYPFNYKFFASDTGRHQVSETETRALADFIVQHPNIAVAFTFGVADSLVQTPKAEPGGKRPPTAVQETDLPYFRELGKSFRQTLGLKKELTAQTEPGTFSDWMYFHRGRLSAAARPWSPALQIELAKDHEQKDKNPERTAEAKPDKKAEEDKRNEEDRAFLKWIDAHAPETFIPWKPIEHPDFPGRKAEVGGFAPYAKSNPPEKYLEPLAKAHASFLTDVASKLPRIALRETKLKALGNNLYDLTLKIENRGYLPTALAQGELTREVFPTRATLKIPAESVLAGSLTTLLGPIPGSGGQAEVRWVFNGADQEKVELEIVSMLGGSLRKTVHLKKED